MGTLDEVQPGLFDTETCLATSNPVPEKKLMPFEIESTRDDIILTPNSSCHDLYRFAIKNEIKNTEGFIRGWFNADKIIHAAKAIQNETPKI